MRSRCLPHGGTFSKGCKQVVQMQNCKRSVNYLKRACKNCVPVAYAVRGFFRTNAVKIVQLNVRRKFFEKSLVQKPSEYG